MNKIMHKSPTYVGTFKDEQGTFYSVQESKTYIYVGDSCWKEGMTEFSAKWYMCDIVPQSDTCSPESDGSFRLHWSGLIIHRVDDGERVAAELAAESKGRALTP